MSLGAADCTYVTTMIRQRSSIDLKPGKEYLVESRLAPIARAIGSDLGGAVKGFKDGVKDGGATAADASAPAAPQQVGANKANDANTVDVEAKTKS